MKLIKDATKEKLRGGFYTPKKIADFVLKWALSGRENSDILEPSCGDGAFLRAIQASGINYKSVTAIEFDADEAQKAKAIKLKNTKIIHSDFHDFCIHSRKRFDVVVGNPPFIRYQFFDKSQQAYAAEIFSKAGMTYSKLTNAWVSFVVGSSLLLKEKGKIAFV
jgi:adenine-specific DNA-methyltransferase